MSYSKFAFHPASWRIASGHVRDQDIKSAQLTNGFGDPRFQCIGITNIKTFSGCVNAFSFDRLDRRDDVGVRASTQRDVAAFVR